MRPMRIILAFAALAVAGSGGVVYYANTPPPPVRVEAAYGPAPGPGYIWVNGYWGWRGNTYVWVPGKYVHAHGRRWIEPRWEREGNRYRFHEGHWER